MKKTLLSGLILASACASAQILVNESFEGTTLPAGFSSFRNADHSSTKLVQYGNRAGTPCDGNKVAYVNLYSANTTREWYFVYSSSDSNGTDLNYSFKYLSKPYSSSFTVNGTLAVEYSIDGGNTWNISTPEITINSETPCTEVTGTIAGSDIPTGSDFKIRWVAKSIGSADFFMGIDSFSASQTITVAPSCATITSPQNGDVVNSITPVINYNAAPNAIGYKVSIGTTPGGTDIIDNTNNGNMLRYTVPASANLQYNTTYYATITPTNNIGDASNCSSVEFNTGTHVQFNDECSTAINITNFPYSFVQQNADQSTNNNGFISICSSYDMNDGLWYKFVGDGSNHTVSITNLESGFDAELQVYSGDCNALTCVKNSDSGLAGIDESVTFPTIAGTEYYINVGHYSSMTDNPEGQFTINVTRETLSTDEVNKQVKATTVSPNPFTDIVRFYGNVVKLVSVVDTAGRIVKTISVEDNSVSLSDLKSGLYILMLEHKDGTKSNVKAIKK